MERQLDNEERIENRRLLRRLQQENKEREMAEALRMVRVSNIPFVIIRK